MSELDGGFGASPLDDPYSGFFITPLWNDNAVLTSPKVKHMNVPHFGGLDH
jgi:hypothetical protein